MNEVVNTAKENAGNTENIITLDDGMRIKVTRISARLVSSALEKLNEPIPPEYLNEKTGQKMSNTSHPDYIKELQKYNKDVERISLEAMIMFGIELLDPIPDNGWEKRLKIIGVTFDESDQFQREFAYKSNIAATPLVLSEIAKRTGGLSDAQVNQAFGSFQSDEKRSGHSKDSDSGQRDDGNSIQPEV